MNANLMVSDLVDKDSGGWNIQQLHDIFTEELALGIMKINLPQTRTKDSVIWMHKGT